MSSECVDMLRFVTDNMTKNMNRKIIRSLLTIVISSTINLKYVLCVGPTTDACACGRSNEAVLRDPLRIIQGKQINPVYKYPWIVELSTVIRSHIICGGVLISPTFVLTAAHCVVHDEKPGVQKCDAITCVWDYDKIQVEVLTSSPLNRDRYFLSAIFPHPQYRRSDATNDIALLKLAAPIVCSVYVRPICLPNRDIKAPDSKVIMAGYGKNKEKAPRQDSPPLLEGTALQIEPSACFKKMPGPPPNMQAFLCIRGSDQTACDGDSGTSIFAKIEGAYYALGIVSSHTAQTCVVTEPVRTTKVFTFMTWIKNIVSDLPVSYTMKLLQEAPEPDWRPIYSWNYYG